MTTAATHLGQVPSGLDDPALRVRLLAARDQAVTALLAERGSHGHWVGELSSSALSTATAVCALSIWSRNGGNAPAEHTRLIEGGLRWLVARLNADGGWGDTDRSRSNISTTTLVWAAFGAVPEAAQQYSGAAQTAERWLIEQAGSLNPKALAQAIAARYGKDRTFSVPILTACALAGRLGPADRAWQLVRQLPFEMAVLPHRFYGALRLPVVSYALPALIAIGQVRHHFRPTRNPATRWFRNQMRQRTLQILASIQPLNGGFLEATPLTSFVTMSLAGMGLVDHPVTRRAVEFLRRSARPDGSWPIDTNLSTWLTTLSVNALLPEVELADLERRLLAEFLLKQQYRLEHPYTHAPPGGWAWTDLPGGVPDADDTAGAVLALRGLNRPPVEELSRAAEAGITWLLGLQNRDGGIPTFCRGWGALPFDRSGPDLTAHAIQAWLAWRHQVSRPLRLRIDAAIPRAIRFLAATQRADGAWIPLWFGHQDSPNDENPLHGTGRVLSALAVVRGTRIAEVSRLIERAVNWLVDWQNRDGGWSGAYGAQSSVEETALAVKALADLPAADFPLKAQVALERGLTWILERMNADQWREPSPIGFYFARLWYYEKLYPLISMTGALNRAASRWPSRPLD